MAQTVCVVLNAVEREQLAAIAADHNRARKHVERARIVLASADRGSAQWVALRVRISRPTVWRWQQRFAEAGVEGRLRDKTRKPGRAPIAAEMSTRLAAKLGSRERLKVRMRRFDTCQSHVRRRDFRFASARRARYGQH